LQKILHILYCCNLCRSIVVTAGSLPHLPTCQCSLDFSLDIILHSYPAPCWTLPWVTPIWIGRFDSSSPQPEGWRVLGCIITLCSLPRFAKPLEGCCTLRHGLVHKTLTYQPNLACPFLVALDSKGLRWICSRFILTYGLWRLAHPRWRISFCREKFQVQYHWWGSPSVSRTGTHQHHQFYPLEGSYHVVKSLHCLLDRHRIASVIHPSPSRIRLMPSFKSELQNPSIAGPDSPSSLYSLDGWGGPSDGVRMYGFLILWRQIDHNWVVNLIEAARWSKITSLLCVWHIFIYTMVSMLIHLCSVYYCLYATDGAIKSFNPIYSNDPFISRILPKSLTPPHTVLSIKKYLCKTEGLSGSNASLFESLPHIC